MTIFDEAQRAWDSARTADFMKRKKGLSNFEHSEPAFLISCMDRHQDWGVIVCLVGGGQEINRGEAGISAWIDALLAKYPQWHIHISPHLHDSEYGAGKVLEKIVERGKVHMHEDLHLAVSMRSFRAERVSMFVKAVLDCEEAEARRLRSEFAARYPIMLTRDLAKAKMWLRERARGSERYGIVASSNAQRLKPHAIDVRSPVNPVHWFLGPKNHVRSSYYLEDAATEFHVQGLELDWAGVVWDGDFRRSGTAGECWGHYCFRGKRWQKVKQDTNRSFLKNAYRVLLTRARQGMVIVVPEGEPDDPTRDARFYDPTFEYLRSVGLDMI